MSESNDDLIGGDDAASEPVDHSTREVATGAINAGGVDQYGPGGANTVSKEFDEKQPGADDETEADEEENA